MTLPLAPEHEAPSQFDISVEKIYWSGLIRLNLEDWFVDTYGEISEDNPMPFYDDEHCHLLKHPEELLPTPQQFILAQAFRGLTVGLTEAVIQGAKLHHNLQEGKQTE